MGLDTWLVSLTPKPVFLTQPAGTGGDFVTQQVRGGCRRGAQASCLLTVFCLPSKFCLTQPKATLLPHC